jgi:quercetin dioxygenase-like cupin family protein
VRSWALNEIETPEGSRSPVVLHSQEDTARAILVGLDPGQELGDHQVKEHTFVLVVQGTAQVAAGGDSVEAGPGTLLYFTRGEQHAISTRDGARLLLLLAPWPAADHYEGSR